MTMLASVHRNCSPSHRLHREGGADGLQHGMRAESDCHPARVIFAIRESSRRACPGAWATCAVGHASSGHVLAKVIEVRLRPLGAATPRSPRPWRRSLARSAHCSPLAPAKSLAPAAVSFERGTRGLVLASARWRLWASRRRRSCLTPTELAAP
jgi:hypothetical protein